MESFQGSRHNHTLLLVTLCLSEMCTTAATDLIICVLMNMLISDADELPRDTRQTSSVYAISNEYCFTVFLKKLFANGVIFKHV